MRRFDFGHEQLDEEQRKKVHTREIGKDPDITSGLFQNVAGNPVDKTAGEAEREAWDMVRAKIDAHMNDAKAGAAQ